LTCSISGGCIAKYGFLEQNKDDDDDDDDDDVDDDALLIAQFKWLEYT
jgi:hypothetical protein